MSRALLIGSSPEGRCPAPGTAYEYCNTNYELLGLVAERVDGKPLAVAMERLFRPLGMQHTLLPAITANAMPEPYSHGYTNVNYSFARSAGGVISTASDLATWIRALAAGRVLNATYQTRWRDSLRPEDPNKPDGQQYGYGIAQMRWGSNRIFFHGGESPGFNSFMGYDPTNKVTLVVWTNLPVSLDEKPTEKLTANTITVKVLDQIYVVSPLAPFSTPTASP